LAVQFSGKINCYIFGVRFFVDIILLYHTDIKIVMEFVAIETESMYELD
jgi:hypothetical protein